MPHTKLVALMKNKQSFEKLIVEGEKPVLTTLPSKEDLAHFEGEDFQYANQRCKIYLCN